MTIQIEAPFSVSDALESLVQEKVGKLDQYFERIVSATVFMKEEEQRHNHSDPQGKTVEIRLQVPRQVLFADASADTYERALADAAQKVTRQLRKHKQKLSRN